MAIGGGEVHVADLIAGLNERGHDVQLAVRPGSPLVERVGTVARIHYLPLKNSLDLFSAYRLNRIIKAQRIDIIHAHMARDYLPCIVAQALSRSAQLILTRHHYLPISSNLVYRSAFKRAAKVIAVSESVRQSLIERLKLPEHQVVTIPNWVGLKEYEKLPDRNEARERLRIKRPLAVATIGRLTPAKGQKEFLRAAHLVRQQRDDCEFLIVGEEEATEKRFEPKLHRLAQDLEVSDSVRFLGYLGDLREVFAAIDVFVLPSLNEGFSIVLIEAMAAGVPAVAFAVGGPAEIIADGETGFLAPPGDVASLADRIAKLLDDASLRQRFTRAARARVESRFEREAVIRRIEAVYNEAFLK